MTYPKVDFLPADEQSGGTLRCGREPALPRDRGAGPALLGAGRHVPGLDRARDGRRGRQQRVRLLRRAAVRQRAAALRPPAHRLRQGRHPALPDDARAPGRAPLRLGLPRAARRARGRAAARASRTSPRSRRWASTRSTTRAATSVLQYTNDWQEYVNRQARWVDFENDYKTLDTDYMESVIWAFKTPVRQGPGLRGLPGAALLLARRDAAVQPRAADGQTSTSQRQDPSVTVGAAAGDRRAGARSGRRRRGRCPATWPWRSGRTSTTSWSSHEGEPATSLAAARLGAYARELGRGRGRAGRGRASRARDLRRPALPAVFDFFAAGRWGTETPTRCSPADHVTTDDGTGIVHMAPAFGEEDKVALTRPASRRCSPVDDGGMFTAEVPPYRGCTCSRPTADHQRPQGRRASLVRALETYDHSYPHCWRCRNPLIYKAVSSWFVEVTALPRPHGRAERADHLGARAHQARPVRQVAVERPRLVDQPEPLLGQPDPGLEVRRPDLPAGRRLRLVRRARADFGVAGHRPAPALHRRADPAQPRRPDRPLDHAPGARGPGRAGSTRARCRSRRCTTRSRTPTGSSTTTRATSSSSTSARPAAGSTRCTCWRRRCSTGRRSARASATASCSATTARKMSKSLRNYPDVSRGLRPRRRRRDALVPHVAHRSCAAATSSSPSRASATACARCCIPLWNTWYFFSLYANAARGGEGYDARWSTARTDVLDRYLLAKLRELVERVQAQLDAYDIAAACDVGARLPGRADELVHPPVAGPLLGRRGRGASHRGVRHPLHHARGAHAGRRRRCCR